MNDEYEFPEYAPNWGQENEEDAYFWSPSMEKLHKPDYLVDKNEGILWKHVVSGLKNLCKETNTTGPFSSKQISQAVIYALVEDTINQLEKDGLIEIVDGDKVRLTEKGKKATKYLGL